MMKRATKNQVPSIGKILNPVDARSARGIFSRGYAKYGVSNAPRPGNLQRAAQRRLKQMRGIK